MDVDCTQYMAAYRTCCICCYGNTSYKKKAEAAAEVKTETKVNFVVEFNNKQNSVEDIINNVKATYGKDVKEISIYLKPDENKAYFVADGEESSMDVFFC